MTSRPLPHYIMERITATAGYEQIRRYSHDWNPESVWLGVDRDSRKTGIPIEGYRVRDTETGELVDRMVPEAPEAVAERAARAEARAAVYKEERRIADLADLEKAYALIQEHEQKRAEAVKTLSTKTISTVEEYDALSEEEKYILIAEVEKMHSASNIDGWGDEGAGYDQNIMVRSLFAAGWSRGHVTFIS